MPLLTQNVDVRDPQERREVIGRLKTVGIVINEAAIKYAIKNLTEDWLQLKVLDVCVLKISRNHSQGIPIVTWARAVQSLYEFRRHKDIEKQIYRLRLDSHEKLDTMLVLLVARRYRQRGFRITFEPFDVGSTDLRITKTPHRLYVEVKRENPQEHERVLRIRAICGTISDRVAKSLKNWLQDQSVRIEVKLTKLFSDPHAEKVIAEICQKAPNAPLAVPCSLDALKGSEMIVLKRDDSFFFERGIHGVVVRVETAGRPVQLTPQNMPVRCTFDPRHNLDALGARVFKAGKQLAKGLERDSRAEGFAVLECARIDQETCNSIKTRFWSRLPTRCWGLTLISQPGWIISRFDLSDDQKEILGYAALDL